MAVLCGLPLRVLWISCLLIISVTCLPAEDGYSKPAPGGYMHWSSSSGSSVPSEYYTALNMNDALASTEKAAGLSSSNSGSTGGDNGYFAFSSEGHEERPQPVLSDVSNMEPVHIFRSRSGYRNGRRHFSRTRYIPGDVVFPPMPVVEPIFYQPIKGSQ